MAAQRAEQEPLLVIDSHQTLVAVPVLIDGQEATQYFVEDTLPVSDEIIQNALSVIGAWSNHDWDEMEQALYDIRHANKPTPPIDSLGE